MSRVWIAKCVRWMKKGQVEQVKLEGFVSESGLKVNMNVKKASKVSWVNPSKANLKNGRPG